MDILLIFFKSLLTLFVQLVVPGLIILNGMLEKRNCSWSMVDAFFLGWLLNVCLALCLLPFTGVTHVLSFWTQIAVFVVCCWGILSTVRGKDNVEKWKRLPVIVRNSFQTPKWLISCTVTVLFSLFVFSHNLGYDDVAHLHYLDKVLDGKIFPLYLELVNNWQAARYPAFGILIGVLGANIVGSGLALYYLLGLLLLISFFIKIYELCFSYQKDVLRGLACTALTGIIVSVVALDNFFNYGLYPLGEGKILFLTGLFYLLFQWHLERSKVWFFMGAGLLTVSFLHHLNIVLLFAVVAPFLLLFIFLSKKSVKDCIQHSCFLFLFIVLAAPATLSPSNGIIHYDKPPPPVERKAVTKVVSKPSLLEKIFLRTKQLANWVQEGRYKNRYIQRAFSAEMFLVPLVVMVFCFFSLYRVISWLCIVSFLAVIGGETIRTVPRQFLTSSFRSGTSWLVFDLLRSKIDWHSTDPLKTDPYTALFLKLLGRNMVKPLDDFSQFLMFCPLVPLRVGTGIMAVSPDDLFLLNGRFWGTEGVIRWQGGGEDALQNFLIRAAIFRENSSLLNLSKVLSAKVRILKEQLFLPMISSSWNPENAITPQKLLDTFSGDEIMIWRDIAVIPLRDLRGGMKVEVELSGAGSTWDIVAIISSGSSESLKRDDGSRWENRDAILGVTVDKDVERALVVVKNIRGHFHGLGRIDSASVLYLSETEKFSFE